MSQRLQELIAVKICHDVSGVLGAVNNGMELYHEADASFQKQALDLVQTSAKEAVARIIFLRYALGTMPQSTAGDAESLQQISGDFFSGKHIDLEWGSALTDAINDDNPVIRKGVLLLLLFFSSIVIKSTSLTLDLAKNGDGDYEISLASDDAKVNIPAEVKAIFAAGAWEDEALTPRMVEAALIQQYIASRGKFLLHFSKQTIKITLSLASIA
jgi:hypothetical protein